jgi:tetratricopeptide (TPR) repeat protein
MRRMISVWGTLALALAFAAVAAAQGTGRLNGEVRDKEGNPWEGVTVTVKNNDTGQTYSLKTDKAGKFSQLGLRSGIYTITVISEKDSLNYPTKFQVQDGQENEFKVDFKKVIAENAAAHPEETAKKEEAENKFKMMKVHFDAGVAAMTDANDVTKQLKTASADQKAGLQQKRTADCETAANEFKQAEQGVTAKDVNNHSMIWGNLGTADECAGHFEDASAAFQSAIDLKPQPAYYIGLSTNLAKAAAAQNDPKVTAAKVAEATASCEKAVALDPAAGGSCYKNLGIVLTNKNPKDAVTALQKASETLPKDTQVWYLLGGALAAGMDFKTEGDKQVAVLQPGTMEAYQKCVDLEPSGPYAQTCKESLEQLKELSGGEATKIGGKKKKG